VSYHLQYCPDVKAKDIPRLNWIIQERIKIAIEQRLLVSPANCLEPLRRKKDVDGRMEWRHQ
jgi:hypothetical protein